MDEKMLKQEYEDLDSLTTAISEYKNPLIKSDYAWLDKELSDFTYAVRTEATNWCDAANKINDLTVISSCLLARNINTSADKKYADKYSAENKNSINKIINLMDDIIDGSLTFGHEMDEPEGCYDFDTVSYEESDRTDVLIDIMMNGINEINLEFSDLCTNVISEYAKITYDKLEKIIFNSEEFKTFKDLQERLHRDYYESSSYIYPEFDENIKIEFIMSDSRYSNIKPMRFQFSEYNYLEHWEESSFLEFMIEVGQLDEWQYFLESLKCYIGNEKWGNCGEIEFDFSKCMFEHSLDEHLIDSIKTNEIVKALTDILDRAGDDDGIKDGVLTILQSYFYGIEEKPRGRRTNILDRRCNDNDIKDGIFTILKGHLKREYL